jgi:hypothetical protein
VCSITDLLLLPKLYEGSIEALLHTIQDLLKLY